MRILRDFLILIASAALIWYLFTLIPSSKENTLSKLKIAQEEQLGDKLMKEIQKDPDFKLIENATLDSALYTIQQRLLHAMGTTEYEYRIYPFDNEMVNAFAMPGGNILVSSGLIQLAEKPEELAAVIAHEMGHVENRHVIYKLIKEIGLSILLTGDQMVLGEVSRVAGSSAFDRRQEAKADEFALALLEDAHIHPIVMASFFRRLSDEVGSYNEKMQVFMTHPHNNARIKAALEYKTDSSFSAEPIELDWTQIKMAVSHLAE
ncbi:MAG: M48 family metalloprotease [Bacteroidetes bacterium]|jgi:predicted Zn-dependent protease|nr:M48 family metalloprotease [Bacteroidota bacterium]